MRKRKIRFFYARPFISVLSVFSIIHFFPISGAVFAEKSVDGPKEKRELKILIDAVHCNEFSQIGLREDNYNYHQFCGFKFAYDYLRSRGITCDRFEQGRLSPEILSDYEALSINLVSADKTWFSLSEVHAIRDYVRSGGSLLLITDHSNCYFHASMLEMLLDEFDIETKRNTVCDRFPNILGVQGNAWIKISRFEAHPLTEDLRFLAIQTGGDVDSRFALAWSSEDSWPDRWICGSFFESSYVLSSAVPIEQEKSVPIFSALSPGFYGNFIQDPDEPSGKLGVVLGKEFGKGRIVIVADQNMWSDTFINYGDNYRLFLNSIAWLLREESLKDPAPYHRSKPNSIWAVEDFDRTDFGSGDQNGMYHTWVMMNRFYWAFANDRSRLRENPFSLALLSDGYALLPEETVDDLVRHLQSGKNILALHTDSDVLELEQCAIGRIAKKLHISEPKIEKDGDLEIVQVPGGGKIYMLWTFHLFNNMSVPDPGKRPGEEQRELIRLFRRVVDTAMQ